MTTTSKRKPFDEDITQTNAKKSKPWQHDVSVDFYTGLRAWFMLNYEHREGSFSSTTSIFEKVNEEKENILIEGDITKKLIGKVIRGIWSDKGLVVQAQKRQQGKRITGYLNLTSKSLNQEEEPEEQDRESWDSVGLLLRDRVKGKWLVEYKNEMSDLSCIHVQDIFYDNQRAITEICVKKNGENIEDLYLMTHRGHEILMEGGLKSQLINVEGIAGKVLFLMSFLTTSHFCSGFVVSNQGVVELPSLVVFDVRHSSGEEGRRGFSKKCQFFTTTSNLHCTNCLNAKTLYLKSMKRNSQMLQIVDERCNHRYMSREMLVKKITQEKNKLIDERQLRQHKDVELLEVDDEDHQDLQDMMKSAKAAEIPDGFKEMWEQQKKIMSVPSKSGYRWHPRIMRLCVELYCKNPHVLDPLREVLYLPSNRSIRYHKNKIEQKPGWNHEVLEWCLKEAKNRNIKPQDYWGGFVIDEMKIQEDLEMVIKNGKHKLVGFVNLGKIHADMAVLSGQDGNDPKLASHVLQIIFIGDNGFRFPVAQFPSGGCTASDLTFIFWEGVDMMMETGFTVYWCALDGAEVNRQFVKLHFKSDAEATEKSFVCHNPYTGDPTVFMFDCKHNFKKIRNNILKSKKGPEGPRCLTVGEHTIVWKQFSDAYTYDQDSFSMPLHEKLTNDHFELDPASKMRNSLAEDVLDKKMLTLMKAYKDHLNSTGQDGKSLDAVIELLTHTSNAIQLFTDKYAITNVYDIRVKELGQFLAYLNKWKTDTNDDGKKFFSYKLWFDLQSMILGFQSIISIKLKKFPQSVIKPAILNQDAVENHFCQVRACNGQNNHPTYKLQESVQNSIIYGQTTISRKSNAGKAGIKQVHN